MKKVSDDSYISDYSDEDPIFTPAAKDPVKFNQEKPFISDPNEEQRFLSFQSVNSIIKQRDEFLKWQRNEIERVWGENFNPFPTLDKISTRIALNQVKEVSTLLEKTCDAFIDSIVHAEFYPGE